MSTGGYLPAGPGMAFKEMHIVEKAQEKYGVGNAWDDQRGSFQVLESLCAKLQSGV